MKKRTRGFKRAVASAVTAALLFSTLGMGSVSSYAAGSFQPDLSEDYDYLSSDVFQFATQAMWDSALRDNGASIQAALDTAAVPKGLKNSVAITYDGTTASQTAGYPCIHFIDNGDPAHRYAYGPLFGSADLSQYSGIVLWLKQGDMFEPYNKRVQIMIGSMPQGGAYNPGYAGNYYVADCAPISATGGYYYIPFSHFTQSGGSATPFDPAAVPSINFISFKTGVGTASQIQQYHVADLRLYRDKRAAENEYVRSGIFNASTEEMWSNNVREGRRTDTDGAVISDTYMTVNTDPAHIPADSNATQSLHLLNEWTNSNAYPAIHFIADSSGTGYSGTANRPLWSAEDFVKPKGIRIWIKRVSGNTQPINIVIAPAGYTTASSSGNAKLFRCKMADVSLQGAYYDIPFSSFYNYAEELPYDPAVQGIPNSIGFKSDVTATGTEYYFADLQLVREPVGSLENVPSQIFRAADDEFLASVIRFDDGDVTAVNDLNVFPADAGKTTPGTGHSIHIVSNSGSYPGFAFLERKNKNVGASLGLIWEEDQFAGAQGIRIWVKRDSASVRPLNIHIGKYTTDITQHINISSASAYYSYKLSNASLEGEYYDIPLSSFKLGGSGESYDADALGAPSWVSFRSDNTNSNAYPMNYWVGDLQVYRTQQNPSPSAAVQIRADSAAYLSAKDGSTGAAVTRAETGSRVQVEVSGLPAGSIVKNGMLKYRCRGRDYPIPMRVNSSLDTGGGYDDKSADSFFFQMPDDDVEIFLDLVQEQETDLTTAGGNALLVYGADALEADALQASSLDFTSRALKNIQLNGKAYALRGKGTIIINDNAFIDGGGYVDWAAEGSMPFNAVIKEAAALQDSCNLFDDYTLSVEEVVEKGCIHTKYAAIAYGEYQDMDGGTIRLYSKAKSISYHEALMEKGEAVKTMLKGKRVLWLGTSIPAGTQTDHNNYPYMVGQLAGVSAMYNMSVGSSPAAAGIFSRVDAANGDPTGVKNAHWQMANYGLSQTVAEKQNLINHFQNFQFYGDPGTRDESEKAKIIGTSYERRVDPYLTGNGQVDVVLYNHGYNDYGFFGEDNMQYGGLDSTDRSTFYGATNFILNRIKEANPDVQIIIVGHYSDLGREGVSSDRPGVNQALKAYAAQYGYLYLDIAPLLGDDFYTLFDDGVHPHKDATKTANMKIAEAIMDTLIEAENAEAVLSRGDVNGDTLLNARDVIAVKKHILGSAILPKAAQAAADMDGDGKATVLDLVLMKRSIAGMAGVSDDIAQNRQNGVFPMFGNTVNAAPGESIPADGEEYLNYNALKKAGVTAI